MDPKIPEPDAWFAVERFSQRVFAAKPQWAVNYLASVNLIEDFNLLLKPATT